MSGYVSAFIGPRDFYEVPLALSEGDILTAHIGDFYAPKSLVRLTRHLAPGIHRRVASRFRDGLSWRKTYINMQAILRQAVDPGRQHDAIRMAYVMDKALSEKAAVVAEKTGSALFLYSGVAYWAFQALPDRPRILFQFHPHPAAVRELLERDVEQHPEVMHSFKTEYDSIPLERLPVENLTEWQDATHIVCASSFTSRSLQSQGCPESRISVVPYGLSNWFPTDPARSRQKDDGCKFLFVGQGIQRKGVHHLLKAWQSAGLKDGSLTLVCSRIDPGIIELARQPGVHLRNKLTADELKDTYLESDIFVMPSLVEGFGLVYAEALAAGLYCIGTTNTGLPDINPPSTAAAIIDPGNVQALAEALTRSHGLWRRGELDREAIRKSCRSNSWSVFRQEIRKIAQRELNHG